MFTGIITDVGTLVSRDGGTLKIGCSYDPAGIDIGASIACDGCCLTVTELGTDDVHTCVFAVVASEETFSKTALGGWTAGRRINLERALAMGAELGGHLVTGHIDCVATIVERTSDGVSERFTIDVPDEIKGFIAKKGSVALDGTSLTVNDVDDRRFGVSLIPHTLEATTWGERQAGEGINLEVDLLARYVARLHETGSVGFPAGDNG